MPYCELCGRQTDEKKAVVVDGTVFNVCASCSKHGKPYVLPPVLAKKKKKPAKQEKKILMTDETMLAPNFAELIRNARTKKSLTHEQLGMHLSEKASLLKRFETSALKPDEILAKKLERFLGIKLYVSMKEDEE